MSKSDKNKINRVSLTEDKTSAKDGGVSLSGIKRTRGSSSATATSIAAGDESRDRSPHRSGSQTRGSQGEGSEPSDEELSSRVRRSRPHTRSMAVKREASMAPPSLPLPQVRERSPSRS